MVFMAVSRYDGAHVVVGSSAGPTVTFLVRSTSFCTKAVVDFFGNNRTRAGRTLLALVAECREGNAFHCCINVGFFVHDSGVFAAHSSTARLIQRLARNALTSVFADKQADFLGTGESDVASLGIF